MWSCHLLSTRVVVDFQEADRQWENLELVMEMGSELPNHRVECGCLSGVGLAESRNLFLQSAVVWESSHTRIPELLKALRRLLWAMTISSYVITSDFISACTVPLQAPFLCSRQTALIVRNRVSPAEMRGLCSTAVTEPGWNTPALVDTQTGFIFVLNLCSFSLEDSAQCLKFRMYIMIGTV